MSQNAETSNLTGSCLCGAVRFRVHGQPLRFYHCHCQRCRKANGTGHATNLLLETSGDVEWISGAELIQRFKVPDAERFSTAFCTTCGSPLPRYYAARGFTVIPAGVLDSEPPIMPQARIFFGSRAAWSCADDVLPVHDTYAPTT